MEKWAKKGWLPELVSALDWLGSGGTDPDDQLAVAIRIYAELALVRIGRRRPYDVAFALSAAASVVRAAILDEIHAPDATTFDSLAGLSLKQTLNLVRQFEEERRQGVSRLPSRGDQRSKGQQFIAARSVRYCREQLSRAVHRMKSV